MSEEGGNGKASECRWDGWDQNERGEKKTEREGAGRENVCGWGFELSLIHI